MKKRSILLLAGEASGDYHAAAMVRDLKAVRPDVRVTGIGGDKLAEAGMELLYHYRDVNTIGLSEGLAKVRNIIASYRTMKQELRQGGHDLFVPVDFPDVNLRLCKIAQGAGVPVCYYISPQVWAWRKGRLRTIAARVDKMMTIFPFEEDLYRDAQVDAHFVGHTMARDIQPCPDKAALRSELGVDPAKHYVALVPGSRPAEVRRILPVMCAAAHLYLRQFPETGFLLPLAGEHLAAIVEDILAKEALPVAIQTAPAARVMAACDSGLVTSGTATLQAALAEMPHAVVYKLDRFTWLLANHVLKHTVMAKDVHVAIANVLAISREKESDGPIQGILDAGHEIRCSQCRRPLFVPELLQDYATPEVLAEWLVRFKTDAALREATLRGFHYLRTMLEPADKNRTPASVVLGYLQ
jgi:lipid-A-disaccharide synthase